MKIDKNNIDEYYDKINGLIDSYFTWNIKPTSLKNYLKVGSIGYKKFLKVNNLEEIEGIDKVIRDVIEDRCVLEVDGVMTFENFISESPTKDIDYLLTNNVIKSNMMYERILSDVYRTSVSHIKDLDTTKHKYNIESLHNETCEVIIYSKDDLEKIKDNLVELCYNYVSNMKVDMSSLFFEFKMPNIDKKTFTDNLKFKTIDNMNIIDLISKCLKVSEFEYLNEYKEYYIWEK